MIDFNASEEYRLAPLKIIPTKTASKTKRFHIKLPVADPSSQSIDPSPVKAVYSIMQPIQTKFSAAYSPSHTERNDKSLKGFDLWTNLSARLPSQENSPGLKDSDIFRKSHFKNTSSHTLKSNQEYQGDFTKAWMTNSNFMKTVFAKDNQEKVKRLTKKQETELNLKRARKEVSALQSNLSKAMNKSKEKILVEEMRDFSPDRKDMHDAFAEVENLRQITRSKVPVPKTFRNQTASNSAEPRLKTSAGPESPANHNLYQMADDYFEIDYTQIKPVMTTTKLYIPTMAGIPVEGFENKQAPSIRLDLKQHFEKHHNQNNDPFDKLILYQNEKMPFSLAVMAKTRHRIFQEVKERLPNQKERRRPGYIRNLREKLVPEEKARFLEQLDEEEKQKKYKDMQSKKAHTNTIYQLATMSKASRIRVKAKMKEHLPINSRFLNA